MYSEIGSDPHPAATIPALLRHAASTFGDHPAIIDDDVVISYTELRSRADDVARAFLAAGIVRGDRVAIWAPNIWEWVVALLGAQTAGGVLVPLNTRYKGTEAAHILAASGARILLTVEGFLGNDYVTMLGGHDLADLEQIILLRGEVDNGHGTADTGSHSHTSNVAVSSFDEFIESGRLVTDADVDARMSSVGPDDLSDLLFTSGTTGRPKGVMCTHGQTVRAFDAWATVVGLRSDDRYLVVNPFFHAFGYKAGIVAALTKGATILPEAVFDVPAVMASIERHAITMIPGPPTLYQSVMNHPEFDATRIGSLRLAVTGAAIVPRQLITDMRNVLGFETVITGYGLTEASGIATMCRHDDDDETIASTSGRAIPGVDVEIHDADGRRLPSGEAGEVCVRGYNVMVGYFNDPVTTAETIDTDGWLHTGDIGVMDDRGSLRITDRVKDMFIVGGFNAYPAEIEQLLADHPQIAQSAVVGIPDDRMGEVGHAFVVARHGTDPDPAEIISWARAHMANYKVPKVIHLVDTLPLNPSGKVLKYELRDRLTSPTIPPSSADQTGTA